MLVINKTSGTAHHKKVRAENAIGKRKDGLFFGIRNEMNIIRKVIKKFNFFGHHQENQLRNIEVISLKMRKFRLEWSC